MERDLDKKLYNDYLNGEKQAFEFLYNKYKNRIEYFIYNIVKNREKAEDLTQETFIYVMQNKFQENSSFKYFLYLVARSKAYNYISVEKRRNEINEKYMLSENEQIDKDVLDIITREENKKELLSSINELDDKYKGAIYLVNIEELSYEETSKILGQTLSNTKTLIHRGKKQLKKILLKKGFEEMNKVSKVVVMILVTVVIFSGVVYAVSQIYKKFNTHHHVSMNPSFQSTLDENAVNNLWVGTLDLAWKELGEKINKSKIELEAGNLPIVDDLNSSLFTKDMLDKNDYEIKVERTLTDGYKIDATLNKELNFLEVFDNFSNDYDFKFGNGEESIKCFGINNASSEEMNKNIEVLFYNKKSDSLFSSDDFAIKLKTKEGDEIILYRTNDNKSFDEYYKDIREKSNSYTGNREFSKDDELRVPYVRVNGMVYYNELYDKEIKDSNGLFIYDVIQNVNFSLNEKGCNLSSKATMVTEYMGIGEDTKFCFFQDTFIIFMKEKDSDNPYFALKVDNDDILEKKDETNEPRLIDYTELNPENYQKYLNGEEYKFYEDEKYEYYYSSPKTDAVIVYFRDDNHTMMTAEEALKQGKITMDLLDKYEIKYIKKSK